jgi:putative ABC transport system ATP-binding protein
MGHEVSMRGESPLLAVEHVGKRYGSGPGAFDALSDVSFEATAGELISVVGPSGSGKSTLLNLIAGLDSPTTGRVRIQGEDLARLSEASRSRLRLDAVGIVFQSFHLFPALTAAENVAWPLELKRVPRGALHRRVHDLLADVGVEDRAHRRPAELSGGEQQRVAIARALACSPRLLLADEPTGNLDTLNGKAVLQLLERLSRERGVTVLMVTHRLDTPLSCAARTIELRDGRLHRDAVDRRGAA